MRFHLCMRMGLDGRERASVFAFADPEADLPRYESEACPFLQTEARFKTRKSGGSCAWSVSAAPGSATALAVEASAGSVAFKELFELPAALACSQSFREVRRRHSLPLQTSPLAFT